MKTKKIKLVITFFMFTDRNMISMVNTEEIAS